jgi:hypothetical protein
MLYTYHHHHHLDDIIISSSLLSYYLHTIGFKAIRASALPIVTAASSSSSTPDVAST